MTMVEEASKIIGFTPNIFWATLGGLIGLGIIVKLGLDLVIKFRELRKPKVAEAGNIQGKLRSDHERLNKLEATAERQDQELKLILRSQMNIIHHMIDGNGLDRLKETQADIEDYLITGKIKERKE